MADFSAVGTDTRRPRSSRKERTERVLLIALSPAREKLLLEEPELVQAIVRERAKVPRSVEFDARFAALQEALLELASKSGTPRGHAEALTPRAGTLLYEDQDIDAAQLVDAVAAQSIARWVTGLPAAVIARSSFEAELVRLQKFYQELASLGHALLSVRFRD